MKKSAGNFPPHPNSAIKVKVKFKQLEHVIIITNSLCWCLKLYLPISEVLPVEVWGWVSDFGTGIDSDLDTSSDTLTLSEVTLVSSPSAVSISFCMACIGRSILVTHVLLLHCKGSLSLP